MGALLLSISGNNNNLNPIMLEDCSNSMIAARRSAEEWLSYAQSRVPVALEKAKEVNGQFPGRWKIIISKLEQIPARLSDLSSHPCFSKNTLCREQLQAVFRSLNEAAELAGVCMTEKYEGKLRMQSDLDALIGKLDLNLRDCGLLIKSRVLGDVSSAEPEAGNLKELLARLQIGHLESKHNALDSLIEILKEDAKKVLAVAGQSNVAALVQLLTATSPQIREKTVSVVLMLVESGAFENWLVSEGVLPPLIRLAESSNGIGKENAMIALQRLSMSFDTARIIVGHGGVPPMIEICRIGDSTLQSAAACVLRNLSIIPEARQTLADEGVVRVMIDLLNWDTSPESREYATECLQNLTSGDESVKRLFVSEDGVTSLLAYLDGPSPHESSVVALKNLIGSISGEVLVSVGVLPRLARVLKSGSPGAKHAAAAAICDICSSTSIETKRLVGEAGCIPLLVAMLEAKANTTREVAARATVSLMACRRNRKEVKKDSKSVPNLVALLDVSPHNTAKKYAVPCLVLLLSSKRCKRLMVSYGAIGYLKKLVEMDVAGAKKLLEHLEIGKLRRLFSKKYNT
ncbi:protein CELLULOSE SYNTHASE INTERACTIVE 1-like isoform X2 [Andrographis paniculata]|uniref:protein CELLULOSE SYNTHASE INTERACTIVE 1-like isoform X2 n=1 Tax=Andrographis paniculata TaxID=175694 RepID=UPI0021E7B85A|nr:protein CELLULOSE SYNTHASE INTERACTIVE 1-like isoform X2 [Andrographis paniculata]